MKIRSVYTLIGLTILCLSLLVSCFSRKEESKSNSVSNNFNKETQMITKSPEPTEKPKEPITFIAVGDILLGRGVEYHIKDKKRTFPSAFEAVNDVLSKGDVRFANLEEPITNKTKALTDVDQGGKIILKNSIESFSAIKNSGFNIVNLASNHIMDYYKEGLEDTLKILDENNIAHAGAGMNIDEARKPAIIEKKGLKIGMLAYSDMADILYKGSPMIRFLATQSNAGVAPRNTSIILEDVKKLRPSVDLVIVSMHWGVENSFDATGEQVKFAHELIDSGVDIILGHHPHRFQGMEIYKGKPIVYSLGNFIFDQNMPENQESFIVEFELQNKLVSKLIAHPIETVAKNRVEKQTGSSAQNILNREMKLCNKLGLNSKIENDTLVFTVN